MIENSVVYATIVFGILAVMLTGVIIFVMRLTDKEGKRPGDH